MCFFDKKELSFAKELPEILEIECPVCLQVMLTDPHLSSCCGKHFCGFCYKKIKGDKAPCPMCKEKDYRAVIDKNTLRIINGLQVHCTNKSCQWRGDLKNLSTHLSKGKRQGQCQFEVVKCRYEKCTEKKQRHHLDNHEKNDCPHRPYQCQYCKMYCAYYSIPKEHYDKCHQYPVYCPNKCTSVLPRSHLDNHLSNNCPLQQVDCPFSWAGCTDKPLRKDSQTHTTDLGHMSLLAVACGKLNISCSQLKKENEQLNTACAQLKKENEEIQKLMLTVHGPLSDNHPVLPVTVKKGSPPIHVYTHMFGYHISVWYMYVSLRPGGIVYLAFHEGKFDKLQPKLPSISVKDGDDELFTLIKKTSSVPNKTPQDILTSDRGAPGVVWAWISCPISVDIVISWE